MSDDSYEILRAAVNIARYGQIKRLVDLRKILARTFPDKDAFINEALDFWGQYERAKRD